jgi:outer membrane cobalamin receptor
MEKMIVFVLVSNRQTKPLNLDAARVRGCETSLTLEHVPVLRDLAVLPLIERIPGRVARLLTGRPADVLGDSTHARPHSDAIVSAQIQWQDARDDGISPIYSGKRLTYHPEWRVRIQIDLAQGRWQVRYAADYRDEMYWARSNSDFKCAAQWRHDLLLRCGLYGERLGASLRVENLADDELEDVRGYPLPGRSWFGGLEARLE